MANSIRPLTPGATQVHAPDPSPPRPATRFSEILGDARRAVPAEGPSGPEALRSAMASLVRGERYLDGVTRAAQRGKVHSPEELLAIQAGVYRYTQELELASKLVDKATGAIKQTLQSQQ